MRPPTKCGRGASAMTSGGQIGISFSIIGYGATPIGEKMDLEDTEHFRTIASAPVEPLPNSQKRLNGGSSHSGLAPDYLLNRAELLFACYRKDEAARPADLQRGCRGCPWRWLLAGGCRICHRSSDGYPEQAKVSSRSRRSPRSL